MKEHAEKIESAITEARATFDKKWSYTVSYKNLTPRQHQTFGMIAKKHGVNVRNLMYVYFGVINFR